jgi:predicted nuclease of predicted toxin-antitoxin system
MLRLVSDEDVHDDVIRGLRRREPSLDIVRVVDVGLDHAPDPDILTWAAAEGRVVVTGDLNSMVGFAWSRVRSRQLMPGVLALLENIGARRVIDDILLVAMCYTPEEMQDQVLFIPF